MYFSLPFPLSQTAEKKPFSPPFFFRFGYFFPLPTIGTTHRNLPPPFPSLPGRRSRCMITLFFCPFSISSPPLFSLPEGRQALFCPPLFGFFSTPYDRVEALRLSSSWQCRKEVEPLPFPCFFFFFRCSRLLTGRSERLEAPSSPSRAEVSFDTGVPLFSPYGFPTIKCCLGK